MRSVIRQSVRLPAAAAKLFEMYLSPELHAAFTGKPVVIDAAPGSTFEAFEGMLSGSILEVVKPNLIVQSWRSANFENGDPDSTLILMFSDVDGEGQVDMIHVDVPAGDFDGVTAGWQKYYWTPWREYLESKR